MEWCLNLVLIPFRFVYVSAWDLVVFFCTSAAFCYVRISHILIVLFRQTTVSAAPTRFVQLYSSFIVSNFHVLYRLVTDPVGDVRRFIQEYEAKHGDQHPPFYGGSYSAVSGLSVYHSLPVSYQYLS